MNASSSINAIPSGSPRRRALAGLAIAILTAAPLLAPSPATAATIDRGGSHPASTPPAHCAIPDTPIGSQTAWLVEISRRLPAPHAEIVSHFSPPIRTIVDTAAFNQALADMAGPHGFLPLCYQEQSPTVAELVVRGSALWTMRVNTDPDGGLITAGFRPYGVPGLS